MDGAAVTQFMGLTNTDEETARRWLAASATSRGAVDVQAALSLYFEAQGGDGGDTSGATSTDDDEEEEPAAVYGGGGHGMAPSAASRGGYGVGGAGGAGPSARRGGSAPRGGRGDGIATLSSLRDDGDEEEEEERESYYAGGERSGQMIQGPVDPAAGPPGGPGGRRGPGRVPGPPGGPDDADEDALANSIFERARARGPLTDAETAAFSPERAQAFTGAGYRLGQTPELEGISPAAAAAAPPVRPVVVGRRNVTRTLTFFRDGFTVDEGPLRRFDDPANVAFLRSVDAGYVPEEMESPDIGNVNIHLVDRKDVDWAESGANGRRPQVASFSGSGRRLGATDGGAGGSGAGRAPVEVINAAAAAAAEVTVDEAAPVATIQIRLADGRRLRGRFNTTHTVGDLRAFVAGRSGLSTFELAMTFPRKVLSDASVTVGDANLNGAVVVQTKR